MDLDTCRRNIKLNIHFVSVIASNMLTKYKITVPVIQVLPYRPIFNEAINITAVVRD
jgi:hypothetical protein